jgi:uncharacterized protein YdeI (YjbR/CyaY-like superfamily)
VPDVRAWHKWLAKHHQEPTGVWLIMAKKGVVDPTSLTYDQALEEALCHGWIDGQRRSLDALTFRQRFTPRRQRSPWSQQNVQRIERLRAEGRMHPAGEAEVERARSDGRWAAAYPGQAGMEVPDDLAAALQQSPAARDTFATLSSQNRYAVLYRISAVKRPETRARKIATYVAMLARGETLHPS